MDEYVVDLQKVKNFQTKNPTLVHQRLALSTDGRLVEPEVVEQFIGEKIHKAGMSFLERIHAEIDDKQPQWVKEQRQNELDELAGKVEDDSPYVPPPLTVGELPPE